MLTASCGILAAARMQYQYESRHRLKWRRRRPIVESENVSKMASAKMKAYRKMASSAAKAAASAKIMAKRIENGVISWHGEAVIMASAGGMASAAAKSESEIMAAAASKMKAKRKENNENGENVMKMKISAAGGAGMPSRGGDGENNGESVANNLTRNNGE
jgi:hypothetical protein